MIDATVRAGEEAARGPGPEQAPGQRPG